jgi:FMN phosphatase YigB (HAD superfamily)
MPEAFQLALQAAGVSKPSDCVMIDDSEQNLRAAHDLGMVTIRVGTEEHADFIDAAIHTIHDLPLVIPVSQSGGTGV